MYEASHAHEQKIQCYAQLIVGTVDGGSYDGQLKYTICDACRPCHSILSVLKHFRQISLQLSHVPRCLDLANFVSMTTTTTRPITLPLAHARGVIKIASMTSGLDLHHTSGQV